MSEPSDSPRVVRFRERLALAPDPPESPVERAAFNVHLACADFVIALQQAQTSAEAEALHKLIGPLVMALGACEDAAALKSDDLKGKDR